MKMAVKDQDAHYGTEKNEVFGRVKSDITTGHETIYERSYY